MIKDIKFDKTTGLAYIPKSYFEKDKNVLITGQVMSAGSIKDQTMSIDTIVDNGGNITKQAVEANTYDVTVKIPITTSKRVADKLKLSDFEVYLNGSENAMDLTKDTAVFDKTTGVLEIAASPASLTSVKVKIKKIGALKSVARLLTNDVSASISGASKLKILLLIKRQATRSSLIGSIHLNYRMDSISNTKQRSVIFQISKIHR